MILGPMFHSFNCELDPRVPLLIHMTDENFQLSLDQIMIDGPSLVMECIFLLREFIWKMHNPDSVSLAKRAPKLIVGRSHLLFLRDFG